MSNISVADILKIHGKWIEGKPLARLVAEKKGITERMAYIEIKKAWEERREILRVPLLNRTVLYGLAEFGPTGSGSLVEGVRASAGTSICLERSHAPIDSQNQKRYSYPRVDFEITQKISGYPPGIRRQFPSVGFKIINLNDYPIRVRVETRMILGGRNLGLIQDPKGHYNGEAELGFDLGRGIKNGNFTVPEECVKSDQELTLEVRVLVIDPDNGQHTLLPRSWTYMRKENDWYFEPKLFTEE